jgi:dTDP-4-amino-4,6-dideoxygalactose transaminase
MIPFIDLPLQHRALEEELVQVFREALRTASFIGGPQVEAFEEEFAAFCGSKYCVGVNSGTDALRFAFIAAGIGPGDAVITVPNTFIATVEAISQAGATPVFVDVDENTHNLDPLKLEACLQAHFDSYASNLQPPTCNREAFASNLKPQTSNGPQALRLTPRPKAVVPVHLYGQPADMDPIVEIAERHGLVVIEDACQAHGAEYFSTRERGWRKCGTIGLAAAFSFYPGKNLGACGEAGALTTDHEEIARKVRALRDHGQTRKYYHLMEGYNGRLDAIQAGFLRAKLRHLPEWTKKRQENAERYNELLAELPGLTLPSQPVWAKHVYHLYVIRAQRRDSLLTFLANNGIACGLHYPLPLHLQNAYEHLAHKQGDFPVAEKASREILSLPMYAELTVVQQQEIAGRIKDFWDS